MIFITTFDGDVYIALHDHAQMIAEDCAYRMLKGIPNVLQAQGHSSIAAYNRRCRNDVCCLSSRNILIWLYPKKPSIKNIYSKLHALLIITLVIGSGNLSLGTSRVKVSKAMQILTLPFFFTKGMILATDFGCCSL